MKHVDEDLYIGDLLDTEYSGHLDSENIEQVLVLDSDCRSTDRTLVHVPIQDNGTNGDEKLKHVIQIARTLRQREGSLLVACGSGLSRSVLIAAALMTLEEGNRVPENVNRIKQVKAGVSPQPDLMKQVNRLAADIYTT
jgi:protein-tyrosine phosphatase